ncbi:hypothetical protein HY214_04750 [Candidatus Roizmanbacteria bacterium]|nr:hypothetical protein [Candidatus Roizmanbacteria bacterium]
MIRRSLLSFFLTLLCFGVFLAPWLAAQTVTLSQEKVIYDLPHPGILPDNPLYFLKAVRDKFTVLLTRDNLKKAETYLLLSDKRAVMAVLLTQKGKETLGIITLAKGEKYFINIPPLLIAAKKQGAGATPDFINTLKVSNAKHREIIETLLKQVPQGEIVSLNDAFRINAEINQQLQKL